MKKTLSLILAGVLALTLGSTALAADMSGVKAAAISGTYYLADDDGVIDLTAPDPQAVYGKTVYFPLSTNPAAGGAVLAELVTESDAVKNASLRQRWELGRELVESAELIKKKTTDGVGARYGYFVAVKLRESSLVQLSDVVGVIELRKSSGDYAFPNGVLRLSVAIGAGYVRESGHTIHTKPTVHSFTGMQEELFDFESGDGYFEGDMQGQDKLLLSVDNEFDARIASYFPTANIDFVNGNYASFNRSGTLSLYADEGSHLYSVSPMGVITEAGAEYDEYEGAFKLSTRTLGRYLISDIELNLIGSKRPAPGTAPGKSVPVTGVC